MASPVYIADSSSAVLTVALDGLSVLFHGPSGMTHIVAPPAPEILAALQDGPADMEEILRRLEKAFDFEPSPSMGEGWMRVNANEARDSSGYATPPQPLPIEGRGLALESLMARMDELEAAGLVRRA
jgi:PqqD family protein of HPr-rel-A system